MFSKKKSSNNNNRKALPESKAKRHFLSSGYHDSLPFPVEYYEPILAHYKSKYGFQGMEIIINGSTPLGETMFAENIAKLQAEIDELANAEYPYALQLSKYWVIPSGHIPAPFFLNKIKTPRKEDQPGFDFPEYYDELYQALSTAGFLEPDGSLKNLDPDQQRELNASCQGLNCSEKLDEYQELILEYLRQLLARSCITQVQAVKEIKSIQANLKPDESVIYFFTNNRRHGAAHFEFLIISPSRIIKPVHWFLELNVIIDNSNLSNIYYTDLTHFISPDIQPKLLQPQVGQVECGALGVLYLKELLKHDAQQLQEFSLTFSIYYEPKDPFNPGIQKVNLFIPSPQALRYSQSSFYNNVVRALFKDGNYENVKYKSEKYKVKTLKKILKDSIDIASAQKDWDVFHANRQLLQRLSEFSKKWVAEYDRAMQKRTTMEGEKYNLYLAYSTHRFERLQNQQTSSNSSEEEGQILLHLPGIDSSRDEELLPTEVPTTSTVDLNNNNNNNNNNNIENDDDQKQEEAQSDIAPKITDKSQPTSIIFNNPLYKDPWVKNPLYESKRDTDKDDLPPQKKQPKK